MFVKHAAHNSLREYRCLAGADQRHGGFARPGAAEHSAVEDTAGGVRGAGARRGVAGVPRGRQPGRGAGVPRCRDAAKRCGVGRGCACGPRGAKKGGRQGNAGRWKDAAAAGHAGAVVRFLCVTFGCGIGSLQVGEDGSIVITAELPGDNLVEVSITVAAGGHVCVQGQRWERSHGARGSRRPAVRDGADGSAGPGRSGCSWRRPPALKSASSRVVQSAASQAANRAVTNLPASQDPPGVSGSIDTDTVPGGVGNVTAGSCRPARCAGALRQSRTRPVTVLPGGRAYRGVAGVPWDWQPGPGAAARRRRDIAARPARAGGCVVVKAPR